MQNLINKVKSYIGFAIKSGALSFGYDSITKNQRKICLILVCKTMPEKALNYLLDLDIQVLRVIGLNLSEFVERENVKAIGLTNKDLSIAILDCSELFEKLN